MKKFLVFLLVFTAVGANVLAVEVDTMNPEIYAGGADISGEFMDAELNEYMVRTYGDGDSVTEEDLVGVTNLNLTGMTITELDWLIYFPVLEELYIEEAQLPVVELADFPNSLKRLSIINSYLRTLNTVGGESLEYLDISNNPNFSAIDLSNLTSLISFKAEGATALTELDFSTVPQVRNIWVGRTGLTSLDLSLLSELDILDVMVAIHLKELIFPENHVTGYMSEVRNHLTNLETIVNPPIVLANATIGHSYVNVKFEVNELGQYFIRINEHSIIENLDQFEPGELAVDLEASTITWVNESDFEKIYEGYNKAIEFWNEPVVGAFSIKGVYQWTLEDEPVIPLVPEEDARHTVNFYNCEGEIIGQDWPLNGTDAKGPSGYNYEDAELKGITFSKDVKPTNCASGFVIPNTGR